MPAPTLDDVLASLRALFPSADVGPDVSLGDLGIDSMDLLEWLYSLVEDHGLELDEERLQAIDDEVTLRDLYATVFA